MNIEQVIDHFVDTNDEEMSLVLLKTLAYPEQGGLGYKLGFFNPVIDMDGWEFDHNTKFIYLDTDGVFSTYTVAELSETLKKALETEILQTRPSLLSRFGWGTGKVLLGVVESGAGLIGIMVPEPGTKGPAVMVITLGVNTITDGFTQLAGANKGNGYNVLGEGAGYIGAGVADLVGKDPELGRQIGKGTFLVSSVVLGSYGNIKILRIPKQTFIRLGVGGRPGGLQFGRLDMMYSSSRAKDGLTILSINNNANQSILRFVMHSGRLVVNGRIVGVAKVLSHESSGKEILKGILKLLAHGAKS